MTEQTPGGEILKERERRKALERQRMEAERRERTLELLRLQFTQTGLAGTSEPTLPPSPPNSSPRAKRSSGASPSEDGSPDRKIGAAVHAPDSEPFLAIDPSGSFDILRLNRVELPRVLAAANEDPEFLATLSRHAERLMARVKQEVDDPNAAGSFLREQVLRWYRESSQDPSWTSEMALAWAGVFAESRVAGGRLEPWLNQRLLLLREEAVRRGSLGRRLRRGLSRDRATLAFVGRTPTQQIQGEVAQALLDDLATHPRPPETAVPLVRLSELAVRRQVPTINEILALLFHAPEIGPFVLLHPNRYPDCPEIVVRPPSAGASGAALAYSLGPARSTRKAPGRSHADMLSEPPGSGGSSDDGTSLSTEEEVDAATVWESEEASTEDWARILKERRRERRRLDSPPKDCRSCPAYAVLRELLLADAKARREFLAVRWRGRPSGIPLLALLLERGNFVPEVATDPEYLEAELGDIARGDPQWKPTDGRWQLPGWEVVREGGRPGELRYSAVAGPGNAPGPTARAP